MQIGDSLTPKKAPPKNPTQNTNPLFNKPQKGFRQQSTKKNKIRV